MISAFKAAEISNKNSEELEKIEEMILKAANRGERCIRYDKALDESIGMALKDLGYKVALRKTDESYIGW